MGPRYQDRNDAGRFLARQLRRYQDDPSLLVLALPRGGVPVGFEVARALNAPLDVFIVRKLGVPGHEELAMGAIASGGVEVLNQEVVRGLGIPRHVIDTVARSEHEEMTRREREYRGDRSPARIRGRRVILVDDGLATGASMRAAVQALRLQKPLEIIVAVPIGAAETCDKLRRAADEVICGDMPDPFFAVGTWYSNFLQVTDEEVRRWLERAEQEYRARQAENHGAFAG